MKKYKIIWGNTPKFRSFVVVPAFFEQLVGGGVCIIIKFGHFKDKQWREYWQKPYLTPCRGGGTPNIKNTKDYEERRFLKDGVGEGA